MGRSEVDDQIGFDIEFDDKTTAFLNWVDSERMEAGVRVFLAETVPGIAEYSDVWWKSPLTLQLLEAAKEFFGDKEGFLALENRAAADNFTRFYGECFVRRAGMAWTNRPEWPSEQYDDFSPAVRFDHGNIISIWAMIKDLFRDSDGPWSLDNSVEMARRYPQGT